MTLSELKNKFPTGSLLRECPSDYSDCFYFVSNTKQCCITRMRSGYALCTFNCSLIRENYPVDSWQIDNVQSDLIMAVHLFRCLVSKLLPMNYRSLHSDFIPNEFAPMAEV